jgi:hypothetical protein
MNCMWNQFPYLSASTSHITTLKISAFVYWALIISVLKHAVLLNCYAYFLYCSVTVLFKVSLTYRLLCFSCFQCYQSSATKRRSWRINGCLHCSCNLLLSSHPQLTWPSIIQCIWLLKYCFAQDLLEISTAEWHRRLPLSHGLSINSFIFLVT